MLLSCRDEVGAGGVLIEPRRQSEELPLVPTLFCLLCANWIGGLAAELVGGGPTAVAIAQVRASYATLLVVQVASALVGAIAVRYLLRTVVGCEITLGAAVAALLAGAAVTLGGQILLATSSGHGHGLGVTSPAAVPLLFVLGPVATFVSYLVLQHTRALQSSVSPLGPYVDPYLGPAVEERERAAAFEHTTYNEGVAAIRESSAGLVDAATRAHLDEVADIVLNGLGYLEAATAELAAATPPANVPPGLHHELVEATRATHDELLAAAREAALGTDPRLRLADSEGMRRIRQALRRLADLGVATEW
jgi:hypothetical protein